MNKIIEHEKCRLCGSPGLLDLFSLGEQYVNNFVDAEMVYTGVKAPLELVMCNECSLVQLKHTAPQELLYSRFYWYRSGVTATMRAALSDITKSIEKNIELNPNDVVLDIGANDGTLLKSYSHSNLIKIGCEPANNLIESLAKNANFVINDFWSANNYNNISPKWGGAKAKVITAIGMFYDLEDPNSFIGDIKKCLDENGIFVAQLMCLSTMLLKNDLGNICHEHIEYYSYKSLTYLFEKNGLEIFNIEQNNVNGGSYRLYARHFSTGSIPFSENCGLKEMLEFKKRIDKNKELCVNFIRNEVAKNKTVYVYGASTKGNVILQYYGLDSNLISGAAERSPEKWGKYTIGTNIKIYSEEEVRNKQPDYFLVLPWAFFDEFYEREKEWREKGGKFIVPLTDFRVI